MDIEKTEKAAFRRLDRLESRSAGKIACPTLYPTKSK